MESYSADFDSTRKSDNLNSNTRSRNPQHRLRDLSQVFDGTKKASAYILDPLSHDMVSWRTRLLRNFYRHLPADLQPARQRVSKIHWLFFLYCLLGCVFFPWSMTSYYFWSEGGLMSTSLESFESEAAPLSALPIDHLLSKITKVYPSPKALDLYILKASVDPSTITACLWATDQDLHLISAWASRWTGPISLLLTTTAEPSSPPHTALLRRLAALQRHSILLNETLSAHILHLTRPAGNSSSRNPAPANPNALLNLARLFAQTSRVALFPANMSTTPPKTLYRSLLAWSPQASSLEAVQPRLTARRPTILTSRGQSGFPFAPLAPVVLGRDDPLWCTERFFVGPSSPEGGSVARAADWEECLWQIWLENFGDVEVRQTRGWLHDTFPLHSEYVPSSDPPAMTKLRRRLAAKYRSETCVLATRQLAALRSTDKALDAKKARWLKRVCRAWTNGASQL